MNKLFFSLSTATLDQRELTILDARIMVTTDDHVLNNSLRLSNRENPPAMPDCYRKEAARLCKKTSICTAPK